MPLKKEVCVGSFQKCQTKLCLVARFEWDIIGTYTNQMIFANIITFGSIMIVAVIVSYTKNIHPLAASFAIAGKKVGEKSTFWRNYWLCWPYRDDLIFYFKEEKLTFLFFLVLVIAFNLGFPEFAKLVALLKSHITKSQVQTLLYLKEYMPFGSEHGFWNFKKEDQTIPWPTMMIVKRRNKTN